MKVSKFLFHAFTVFLTFQFLSCFKAKRAPYDSSSPEGLARNLAIRNLKPIPLPEIPQNTPQPPIIKKFQVSTKNVNFETTFQITWEVEDPNGDPITCELDFEPDGVTDHTEQNCSIATKNFTLPRTGLFTPTLKVSDGTYQTQAPPSNGSILSELAGQLDSSFASTTFSYDIFSIQPLPNGKILALGNDSPNSELYLLNEDGSLAQYLNFIIGVHTVLALQKDGKILVAGTIGSDPTAFRIERLLPDLSSDNTFGFGGAINHFNDSSFKNIEAIQVDENGRIVLAGNYTYNSYAVIRLNPDGSLDTSFGSGGMKNFTADTSQNSLYGLSILPSGKILVSGSASDGTNGRFVVARLNSDGSLDTSFGTGGIAKKEFTGLGGGRKHVIQKDGKIVVIGYSTSSGNQISTLVRFNENGSIDTGFGTGGVVTTDIYNNDRGYNVYILEDGKIFATGEANNSANYPLALRYLNNGNLDTSFGTGGKFVHSSAGNCKASALDNKGRLLLPGADTSSNPLLLRLK